MRQSESSPSNIPFHHLFIPVRSVNWVLFGFNQSEGSWAIDAPQHTKLIHQLRQLVPLWPDRVR